MHTFKMTTPELTDSITSFIGRERWLEMLQDKRRRWESYESDSPYFNIKQLANIYISLNRPYRELRTVLVDKVLDEVVFEEGL